MNVSGKPPFPRASMGFASAYNNLYVFGGVNSTGAIAVVLIKHHRVSMLCTKNNCTSKIQEAL